ncbi:MAG: hypothetical protein ACRYFU_15215 [Janthinobacterium lividum]
MGSRICKARLAVGLLLACGVTVQAQVFVVGMKTATADAVTEFHPTRVALPDRPLNERGRLELIRNLEAEQGFAHRELPLGAGLTLLANGNMTPRDGDYRRMLYEKGQSASPGDRVEISKLEFKADRIVIDLNGGPYAKHRFLSHISLNNMALAQEGPIATGCRITLVFEGGVPEVTAAEVKALLDPVVDFKAKSGAEAYADTLPPKVRDAVDSHEVLVGMTRRMVLASVGAPRSKHREHTGSDDSEYYEEWIYGEPPQATQFVRFKHDHVVRLEIAALGKPVEIREKNELGEAQTPTLEARTIVNGDVQPDKENGRPGTLAPTLRRPGDTEETISAPGMGKVAVPVDTPKSMLPSTVR